MRAAGGLLLPTEKQKQGYQHQE